ncbi:MAG: lysozyme [Burkholderiaceae bacterium]
MSKQRIVIGALTLSAATFVGLLTHEGYREKAYIPVPGDVATAGFGTTKGVKLGDTLPPVQAVQRAMRDTQTFEAAIRQCVKVPLHQYEYDAYVTLTYNIGEGAFCRSTLVRKLNAGDYGGACLEILKWDNFKGKPLPGLTKRRKQEYQQCAGPK